MNNDSTSAGVRSLYSMINILINDNNDILNPGSWGEVCWILGSFLNSTSAVERKLHMSSMYSMYSILENEVSRLQDGGQDAMSEI